MTLPTLVSRILPVFAALCIVLFFLRPSPETFNQPGDELLVLPGYKSTEKTPRRAGHPDEYFRYHQSIRTKSGDVTPRYPPNYRIKELLKAHTFNDTAFLSKQTAVDSLPWEELGPYNVAGRARIVLPDPSDSTLSTWYVGSASGGIWKTENRGESWNNLTQNLTNLSTTTLAISKNNPDIIYAGTGEGFGRTLVYGQGMWKSMDKGATWTQMASTAEDVRFTNIMRIIVDPADENHLVVASASGVRNRNLSESSYLFRSTDGGATWSQTYVSQGTLFEGRVEQVVASPDTFAIQYATVNSRAVLKSIDSGQTWEETFTVSNTASLGRMELAVAPSDPSRLYIAAEVVPRGASLYTSNNGGDQWLLTNANDGQNVDWFSGQGWYDNTIAVHPYDPTIVYTGGIDLMKITVGVELATQISPLTDAYGQYPFVNARGVHPDHHGITLVPTDSTTQTFLFLNANDGGIAFSVNGGQTFTQTGETWFQNPGGGGTTNTPLRGLNTSQFYGIDKMNGARRYIGGTQDNGSWLSPFNPSSSNSWQSAPSGDGFEAAWHYRDPNKIIETSQFNFFFRSQNGGDSWSSLIVPGSGGPFVTRLAKSNQDPDLIFAVDSSGVLISENFGTRWELLQPEGWPERTTRRNAIVRISLASQDVVWAGSHLVGDSTLYVSTDGASSFTSTNAFDLVSMGPLTGLATHPSDPETAFALFSYANAPKILRTNDLGQTWEDLSGFGTGTESTNGFPDVATYCLLVMPFDENRIWAGTEIGLFESYDGGQSWAPALNGLPAVSIWQMRIVNEEIVLATHGRGVWTVALPELDGYEPLPSLLRPIVSNEDVDINGMASYTLTLREAADSTTIHIDGEVVHRIASNTDALTQALSTQLETTETRTVTVQAVSYVNGASVSSRSRFLRVVRRFAPQASFSTDFSGSEDAFLLDGFSFSMPDQFADSALHSVHPYNDNVDHTARLMIPIIVAEAGAMVRYEDIALVERGQPGSEFGDFGFYDYVVLEGSTNGTDWIPLADGYDATFNDNWAQFQSIGAVANPALFIPHEVNLLDTFLPGDEVLLRFRLFADQSVNGWGWVIDNLEIQTDVPTAVDDEAALPTQLALHPNYPNPFREQTTISYALATPSSVTLAVYDMLGRRIQILQNEPVRNPGTYEVSWNSGALASGTYHIVLTTSEGNRTRTAVKIQ